MTNFVTLCLVIVALPGAVIFTIRENWPAAAVFVLWLILAVSLFNVTAKKQQEV
jgi:hypothetical protein